MLFAGKPVEQIGKAGVEIDLNQDRHCQQADDGRLRDDLLALKSEQQNKRRQQSDERSRAELCKKPVKRCLPATCQHPATDDLRDADGRSEERRVWKECVSTCRSRW